MSTGSEEPQPPHALPPDIHEQVYVEQVRKEMLETTSAGEACQPAPASE
jgi:hypothetical protein